MTEQWQELKTTITEMRDNDGTGSQQDVCRFLVNYMETLEKQMQQPKTGHWIKTKEISTNRREQIVHEVICSECSGLAYFRSMGNKYIGANLCPNCGAKMVEPQESEDKE